MHHSLVASNTYPQRRAATGRCRLGLPFDAQLTVVLVAAACLALPACVAPSKAPSSGDSNAQKSDHDPHAPTVEHRFADADQWAKRFEDPQRDEWQQAQKVLDLLSIRVDAKIADIGSATGYFPVRFARAAPAGMVYGLDIEPDMVRYLNQRASDEGLSNLRSILAAPDDPKIPELVDLIFLCNTYHHIGRRVDYFRARRADLTPGGRVAVVDFKPGDLPVGPPPGHKLAPERVVAELTEAGYALVMRDETLPYQYVLVFEPTHRWGPQ